MATFVLVHGGFADGLYWGDTATGLEAAGHEVIVADLPSTGPDPAALGGLADDVAEVRRLVEGAGGPVVLVGHSYAGVVLTELADHPGVAHAVFVSAAWPARGRSLGDLFGGEMPSWVVPHASGLAVGTVDDAEVTHQVFCAEMPPERWRSWHRHQMGMLSATAALGAAVTAPDRTHPVTYVVTERDEAVPPAAQEAMAAQADHIERMPTSHWSMHADPEGFRRVLETVATGVDVTAGVTTGARGPRADETAPTAGDAAREW